MGRHFTREERTDIRRRMARAKAKWIGAILDYDGMWTRTVVDAGYEEAKDRIIFYLKGHLDDGMVPITEDALETQWDDPIEEDDRADD